MAPGCERRRAFALRGAIASPAEVAFAACAPRLQAVRITGEGEVAMRTFIAAACFSALSCVSGCVTEATDAVAATPLGPPAAAALDGYEMHRMFQEEKARAASSELPAQF
jgi:hypothetical protein